MDSKRRLKLYILPLRELLNVFRQEVVPGKWFSLPVGVGVPSDAVVKTAYYMIERDAMGLVVYSDEFPEVADDCILPVADGCVGVERMVVQAASVGEFV